jgi:hypothetical protein
MMLDSPHTSAPMLMRGASLLQRVLHPTDHVQQDIHPTDNLPTFATRRVVCRARFRCPARSRTVCWTRTPRGLWSRCPNPAQSLFPLALLPVSWLQRTGALARRGGVSGTRPSKCGYTDARNICLCTYSSPAVFGDWPGTIGLGSGALPMLVRFSLCVSWPAWCLTANRLLHTLWRGLVGEQRSVSSGPRDAHMLSSLTACAPCLPQVLAFVLNNRSATRLLSKTN